MNVSLPENLKSFVDERVEFGGYQTASDYVRDLIRQDQERQRAAQERLEAKLLAAVESLRSGAGVEATPAMWERLKERLHANQLRKPQSESL